MPLKADPADQALLLDVQQLDTRIAQLTARAAKLPEAAVVVELTGERDALTRTLAQQSGASEDAQAEVRRTESDVSLVEARIRRDEERLAVSTSAKDAQALEQELGALAKRKSDLEDIELAVMETAEQAAAEVAATRAALDDLAVRIQEAMTARDAAAAGLADDRRHAVANRATVADKVPDDLLALYEKQRDRYGVGASLLRRGTSTATGVMLTSSDLNVIRAAAPDEVLICPESQAVLIRTEESGL